MEKRREDLDFELRAAQPNTATIEQLQASLEQAKEEKRFQQGQLDDISAEKTSKDELGSTLKGQLETAQREVSELNQRLGKLEEESESLSRRRDRALIRKNTAIEALETAQGDQEAWELYRGSLLAKIETNTRSAETAGPRVEVDAGDTYEKITRRIERHRRERERAQEEWVIHFLDF